VARYDETPSPNKTDDGTLIAPWNGGDIVTPTLEYFGKHDLLAFINKYWISRGKPNWDLWQHEFSKHAVS
jgi:ribonuclease T2